MRYAANVEKEGKYLLAEFPDCPGCQTFAESAKALEQAAGEALEGWLEAHLIKGEAPPEPNEHRRAPKGGRLLWVDVPLMLGLKLQIRWGRHRAHMTQGDLAKRMGVSQPMVAKLEDPDYAAGIELLRKAAAALGRKLVADLVEEDKPAHHA